MSRLAIVVSVAVALLLSAVLYQQSGINRRLDALEGAVAAPVHERAATPGTLESPAERERRLDAAARRQHESVSDATEVLRRSLALDEDSRSPRRPTPDEGRRPSVGTPEIR